MYIFTNLICRLRKKLGTQQPQRLLRLEPSSLQAVHPVITSLSTVEQEQIIKLENLSSSAKPLSEQSDVSFNTLLSPTTSDSGINNWNTRELNDSNWISAVN